MSSAQFIRRGYMRQRERHIHGAGFAIAPTIRKVTLTPAQKKLQISQQMAGSSYTSGPQLSQEEGKLRGELLQKEKTDRDSIYQEWQQLKPSTENPDTFATWKELFYSEDYNTRAPPDGLKEALGDMAAQEWEKNHPKEPSFWEDFQDGFKEGFNGVADYVTNPILGLAESVGIPGAGTVKNLVGGLQNLVGRGIPYKKRKKGRKQLIKKRKKHFTPYEIARALHAEDAVFLTE
jgi:hypothetical protein